MFAYDPASKRAAFLNASKLEKSSTVLRLIRTSLYRPPWRDFCGVCVTDSALVVIHMHPSVGFRVALVHGTLPMALPQDVIAVGDISSTNVDTSMFATHKFTQKQQQHEMGGVLLLTKFARGYCGAASLIIPRQLPTTHMRQDLAWKRHAHLEGERSCVTKGYPFLTDRVTAYMLVYLGYVKAF